LQRLAQVQTTSHVKAKVI